MIKKIIAAGAAAITTAAVMALPATAWFGGWGFGLGGFGLGLGFCGFGFGWPFLGLGFGPLGFPFGPFCW